MNDTTIDGIKEFIAAVHENAKNHGWYDEKKSFGEIIALIHSELSEALEFEREKNRYEYVDYQFHYVLDDFRANEMNGIANKKPDGVLPELADVVIRIFDYVGSIDRIDDFIRALQEKHEYNKTRSYKHGGKTI